MANVSAQIASGSRNYVGNAGLGGGTFGVGQLDVRPIMDLARYTMMYNQAEYNQRQKDAEKAAAEIADATSYDLTTGIPKDAQILQDKYKQLTDFIAANPDAINYRNKEKWLEYQKLKSDLANDLKGAKTRNLLFEARRKEISDEPIEARKKLLEQNLMNDINGTGIRTPLPFSQKYDISIPDIPKPAALQFDVAKQGSNEIVVRDFKVFDVPSARRQANVYGLDLEQVDFDPSTRGGQERSLAREQNFYLKGADQLNAALQDPSLRDANGNLDKSRLKGMTKQLVGLFDRTNQYLESEKAKIAAGVYRDNLGNTITFGEGPLKEEDYSIINYADGISPDELALAAQFALWSGDKSETKIVQTNEQIEAARLAEQIRSNKAGEAINWANFGLQKDKLDQADQDDLNSAESVINETLAIISKGEQSAPKFSGRMGKFANNLGVDTTGDIFTVADPATLQSFGKLDKDGNVYDIPDFIEYNKKNNQLNIGYNKEDGVKKIPMDERTWISLVTKRKFPNKDIGKINTIVEEVIKKNKNLYELSKKWPGAVNTNNSPATGGSKWDQYKTN